LLQPPEVMISIHRLQESIASVLRRHASFPLLLPPISLKKTALTPHADPFEDPQLLLDRSGALLSLHTAGRRPLLPYLAAAQPLTTFKRHSFAHALKRNPQGGLPREQLVADFDICLPPGSAGSPATAAAVEAELLRAAHDILLESGVPLSAEAGAGATCQISHPALTSALLAACGAPPPSEPSYESLLTELGRATAKQQLDSTEWGTLAARLTQRELCTPACAAMLYKYAVLPEWRVESLHKLATVLKGRAPPAERPAALAALGAIERALACAAALGVPSRLVSIEPMLRLPLEEFPDGVHFQMVIPGRGVLVRAGRWDALCSASGLGERCAGGLSVFINRLLGASEALLSPDPRGGVGRQRRAQPASAIDVLVCSVGPGLEAERLRVVGELWQAGTRADATHGEAPELTVQMAQAELSGAPAVLLLRRGEGGELTASLKPLRGHKDEVLDAPTTGGELAKLLQAKRAAGLGSSTVRGTPGHRRGSMNALHE